MRASAYIDIRKKFHFFIYDDAHAMYMALRHFILPDIHASGSRTPPAIRTAQVNCYAPPAAFLE